MTRSVKRRVRFKTTQRAVEKDENRTYKAIMDGSFDFLDQPEDEEVPDIREVEAVYTERLETVTRVHEMPPPPAGGERRRS